MPQFYDPSHVNLGNGSQNKRPSQPWAASETNSANRLDKNGLKKSPSIAGKALKFAFTPGIGQSLHSVKFAWHLVLLMVAQLFIAIKLIRPNHPCGDLRTVHNYRLFKIVKLASRRVRFDRAHLPQAITFSAVLLLLFMLALGIVMVPMQLLVGNAHAQVANGNAASTLLNSILDMSNNHDPLFQGIMGMMRIYSNTVLVLAGIVLIYIVISTVAEAAQSGQPFGKNFNQTWGPMRLIIALGLLIPLSGGLNSGQHMVLYLAKWGSDVASTMWKQFAVTSGVLDPSMASDVTVDLNQSPHAANLTRNIAAAAGLGNPADLIRQGGSMMKPQDTQKIFDKALEMEICNQVAQKDYINHMLDAYIPSLSATRSIDDEVSKITNPFTSPTGSSSNGNKFAALKLPGGDGKGCGQIAFKLPKDEPNTSFVDDYGRPIVVSQQRTPEDQLYIDNKNVFDALEPRISGLAQAYVNSLDAVSVQQSINNSNKLKVLKTEYNDLLSAYTVLRTATVAKATSTKAAAANGIWQGGGTADPELSQTITDYGWLSAPISVHVFANYFAKIQEISAEAPTTDVPISSGGSDLLAGRATVGQTPTTYEKLNAKYQPPANSPASNSSTTDQNNMSGDWMVDKIMSKIVPDALKENNGSFGLCKIQHTNPISSIASCGRWALASGWATIAGVAIASGIVGTAQGTGLGIIMSLMPIVIMAVTALFTLGTAFAFAIPLMPVLRFVAGTLGWFIMIFILLLGIPIIALAQLSVQGEGIASQRAMPAFLAIFGIVFRPLLMVFGLMCGLALFSLAIRLMDAIFVPAFNHATWGNTDFIFYMFLYSTFITALANSCFKLIEIAPDEVFKLISIHLPNPQTGDDTGQVMKAAEGAALIGSLQHFGQAGSGIGNFGMQQQQQRIARDQQAAQQAVQQQQHQDLLAAQHAQTAAISGLSNSMGTNSGPGASGNQGNANRTIGNNNVGGSTGNNTPSNTTGGSTTSNSSGAGMGSNYIQRPSGVLVPPGTASRLTPNGGSGTGNRNLRPSGATIE